MILKPVKMRLVVAGAVLALGLVASAATLVSQPIELKSGWNAIYVHVSPTVSADELFTAWPVPSVSAYNAAAILDTTQNAAGLTGEAVPHGPFGIWLRGVPASSTLASLPADTVLVCFNTNATAFTTTLAGIPAAPRLAWHSGVMPDGVLNYVGVHLSANVSPSAYFAGSGIGSLDYYAFGGTAETNPVVYTSAGTGGLTLKDGDAILVASDRISDWSGPLYVSPVNGVAFGTNSALSVLTIRNDGATSRVVTVAGTLPSSAPAALLWRDGDSLVTNGPWTVWSGASKTVATGVTWTLQFALDRSKLSGTGNSLGGILTITDGGPAHMLVDVPITATDVKGAGAVWPAGLWNVSVSLDKVSRYVNDATRTDGLAAGGTMKLRLLVHVDADGNARLLQRVILAGKKLADGSYTQNLYAPSATVPSTDDVSMRISCAALPVDLGVLEPTSGAFLSTSSGLTFNYTVGAKSPSNPFRHPLHPMFDGLKGDFKTAAPDGDNFTNYVGSVKPELFSVAGTIILKWDANGGTAWNPEETLTGTCRWGYTGLRRQGPVWADGTFSMQRIIKDAVLNK